MRTVKMVELECVGCGLSFERAAYKERTRKKMGRGGPYCTTACARKSQRNRLTRKCGQCGIRVTRSASHIRRTEQRGGTVYCSQACNGSASREPATARFDRLWQRGAAGCWQWMGAVQTSGHGAFRGSNDTNLPAHRFSFERAHGRPVKRGRELHHACNNPACVNPEHLQELTRREHMEKDGRLKRATAILPKARHARWGTSVTLNAIT